MKYLYYKSSKKFGEGLLDRRSCLMILLAEAKLSNRIAIIPKFQLGSQHNNGKPIESYLIEDYINIDKLNVHYILEENFLDIEKRLDSNAILNIEDKKFNYNTNETLVIRNLQNDNFWNLKKTYQAFSLAKLYHGVGVKFVIPLVTAPSQIKQLGDNILNRLEKPVIGLHLRRGDRLNKKLNASMDETIIVNKLKDFNYNSVFYCSNDQNYRIENSRFFSSTYFSDLLKDIKDNYLLFAIEMYVVDHCDISVRTFNDSSPFYYLENKQNKNYSICTYSMHGSNNSFMKIPKQLVKCNYEDYDKNKRKSFVKSRPIVPRFLMAIKRKLKLL
ncbi:hypothetical protein [Winogradskyella schleiferi]|uniref:hypothetical protein n=1 Tax=Winogradskyella schleiferi TaxID=2686078 RepID=UPI0015BB03FA|nr:hypothetical protein [Winogradskyella schleiferi]